MNNLIWTHLVTVNNKPNNSSLTRNYQPNICELDPQSMGSKLPFTEERNGLKKQGKIVVRPKFSQGSP